MVEAHEAHQQQQREHKTRENSKKKQKKNKDKKRRLLANQKLTKVTIIFNDYGLYRNTVLSLPLPDENFGNECLGDFDLNVARVQNMSGGAT